MKAANNKEHAREIRTVTSMRSPERGDAFVQVIVYIAIIAVVLFIGTYVVEFIFSTKESRKELGRRGTNTTVSTVYEPGGYTVEFNQ